MEKRVQWLYLDLNSYFASVEQQLNPRLRGRPVAVVPTLTDSTSVIAASIEAKKFGIKTNTRVGDAKKMCPGITLIAGDHTNYINFHHKILQAVENCLPISHVMSIDEVACELIGKEQLIENATHIAKAIKKRIQDDVGDYLKCSIGLGPNRLLAKIASDMQKPDGLTVILKEELPQRLYPLQLRDFPGIGAQMEKRLHNYGIITTQQLLSLDSKTMKSIWGGIHGEEYFAAIHGNDQNFIETTRRSFSHSHVLPPNLRTEQGAYAVAQKMTHKLSTRLRKHNYFCRELSLSIRFLNQNKWKKSLKFQDCNDHFSFLKIIKDLWQQKPNGKILKISVWATDLIEGQHQNLSLFEHQKFEKLSRSIDQINQKYGKKAITFAGTKEAEESAPVRVAFTNIPDTDN